MDRVAFITTEQRDADLIVSFVIEGEAPGGVKSLILMRSPKYEFVFDDHERGVNVSHEDFPERDDELLRRIEIASDVVTIESTHNRFELDVSRVERKEITKACTILHKMNFDDRFAFEMARSHG
jgi:hypothetical protein